MNNNGVASLSADTPEGAHQRWQERRFNDLSAPESWFGLVGLYWLEPGTNAVGSAPGSAVALPEGPEHFGELVWDGSSILWRPAPDDLAATGETVLRTDRSGEPSRVRCGDLEFFVIERDGRPAVRLRDLAWRVKRAFAGIDCYPFDPAWRIEAFWQPFPEPWSLGVQSVTGELKTISVPARAVFRIDGEEYALLPLEIGEDEVFFVFRDATSGRETYGGGRFLKARPPADGRIVLDFNRAFNPPCAFTAFATCSLAPPENRLPIPVRAGEKKYAGAY